MTDYEKLKAFAEELVPNCFDEKKYHTYNNERVVDTEYSGGNFGIFSNNERDKFRYYEESGDVYKINGQHEENLDEWIDETREYWRKKGLPSLQKKGLDIRELIGRTFLVEGIEHLIDYRDSYEDSIRIGYGFDSMIFYKSDFKKSRKVSEGHYELYYTEEQPNVVFKEVKKETDLKPLIIHHTSGGGYSESSFDAQLQVNSYPNEIIKQTKPNKIMKNIKDTLKALTHSKEDKALIKAGLKNENANWTREAKEFADDLVRDERMAKEDFAKMMLKVAEERNTECK